MPSQTEIRQRVTDSVIEALRNRDLRPWRTPWASHPNGRGLPCNAVSHRSYSGLNPLLLNLHARRHGFKSRHWATFDQWRDMGASVMNRPAEVDILLPFLKP